LRGLFIRLLANIGDDELAVKNAFDLHDSYLNDAGSVEPNVAAAAAGVVALKGDSAQYEVFLKKYQNPSTPQEERRYQSALSAFQGQNEMKRTLAMALDGTVRTQDAPYLLAVCVRRGSSSRTTGIRSTRIFRQTASCVCFRVLHR